MKVIFLKIIYFLGGFFFWLSLLMVLFLIFELTVLPSATTFTTQREKIDFLSKGGCYTYSGDVGMEIACDDISKRTFIEYFLNFPSNYILMLTFVPLLVLNQLTVGGVVGNPYPNLLESIIYVLTLLIWLSIVASIFYYIGKKMKGALKKIKNN